MSTNWSGDLIVYIAANGQHFVAALAPLCNARIVGHYKANGPVIPVPMPEAMPVADPGAWMEEKRQAGFNFQRLN